MNSKNGDHVSLLELAKWAKEKFQLRKLPRKQTISRIIRSETRILEEISIKDLRP